MFDLKKLLAARALWSLDRFVGPALLPAAYLLGLATIALWAVAHLVGSFSLGFMSGIWGLLEIAVFGGLLVVGLRTLVEFLIVFFRNHADQMASPPTIYAQQNLIEDVQAAIEQLTDETSPAVDRATEEPASKPQRRTPRKTANRAKAGGNKKTSA